jgi:hypothetical protein
LEYTAGIAWTVSRVTSPGRKIEDQDSVQILKGSGFLGIYHRIASTLCEGHLSWKKSGEDQNSARPRVDESKMKTMPRHTFPNADAQAFLEYTTGLPRRYARVTSPGRKAVKTRVRLNNAGVACTIVQGLL